MADRRRPGALHHHRPKLGCTFTLSDDAIAVMRAIRGEVDDRGGYSGTDAHAAALAGISVLEAATALAELSRKGKLKLHRAPPPRP